MLWHAMWIGVESFAICFTESVEGISIQEWGKGGGGWGGEGRGGKEIKVGQEKKSRERRLIAKVDMIITRAIMKCPTTLSLSRED